MTYAGQPKSRQPTEPKAGIAVIVELVAAFVAQVGPWRSTWEVGGLKTCPSSRILAIIRKRYAYPTIDNSQDMRLFCVHRCCKTPAWPDLLTGETKCDIDEMKRTEDRKSPSGEGHLGPNCCACLLGLECSGGKYNCAAE